MECAELRLNPVVGLTELRRGGDTLQVANYAHGEIEVLGQSVQFMQRTLAMCHLFEALLRLAEQLVDCRPDVLRLNLIEGNAELDFEQWIHVQNSSVTHEHRQSLVYRIRKNSATSQIKAAPRT